MYRYYLGTMYKKFTYSIKVQGVLDIIPHWNWKRKVLKFHEFPSLL